MTTWLPPARAAGCERDFSWELRASPYSVQKLPDCYILICERIVKSQAGSWDINSAPEMTRVGEDQWELVVDKRLDGASFKLAVCGPNGPPIYEDASRTISRFWGWPTAEDGAVLLVFGNPAATTVMPMPGKTLSDTGSRSVS